MAKSIGTTGTKTVRKNMVEQTSFLKIPPNFCTRSERALMNKIIKNEKPEKFSNNDLIILKNYVELLEIQAIAKKDLDLNGLVLMDAKGKRYKNPNHAIYTDATGKLSTLATRLQLNPSSRNRKGSSSPPDRDQQAESTLSRLIKKPGDIIPLKK